MIQDANAKEMEAIQFLAALDGQLIISEPDIKDRLKRIPDAWRQYRIAKKFVSNVIIKLYETLPDKTLIYLDRLHHRGEVIVRMKPVRTDDGTKLVPADAINILVNSAINAECPICLRTPTEMKKCKLRKALMIVAPPDNIPNTKTCPYLGIQEIEEDFTNG